MPQAALVALLAAGCTTHITTHPEARIYVDDELVGTGTAEIGRIGPPREVVIRVEHQGAVVERTIDRDFEATTVLFGLFSFYTGFYWGWSFPEEVHIDAPEPAHNPWLPKQGGKSPWGGPGT
jgi:hypothetical protein